MARKLVIDINYPSQPPDKPDTKTKMRPTVAEANRLLEHGTLGDASTTRLNMGNPQHARLASAAFKAGVIKPVPTKVSTGTSPRPASSAAPKPKTAASTTRLNPSNPSHASFLSAAFRAGAVKPK